MPGPRKNQPYVPTPTSSTRRPGTPTQTATAQPTPEQTSQANEQARLNNQKAVWDPKTASYSYVPLSAGELAAKAATTPGSSTPGTPPAGPAGASTTTAPAINPSQPQSIMQRLEAAAPRTGGLVGGNMGGATKAAGPSQVTATQGRYGVQYQDPNAVKRDPNASPGFASVDYSRYDQAASAYARAESTFLSELDRLSGVDPFGNQAFLRKATDRAVAQARGTAAMTRGGPAAQAGAARTAVGVQSQLAARGAEEQTIQRSRDEVAAGGLRAQAAAGLAGVAGDRAANEVELAKTQTATMSQNLNAWLNKYGIDRELAQSDVENLRNVALEYSKLAESGRQADVDALLKKYGIDEQTRVQLKQIAAGENISTGEFMMGLMGAAAGVGSAIALRK